MRCNTSGERQKVQKDIVTIHSVRLLDLHERTPKDVFTCGEKMLVEVTLSTAQPLYMPQCHIIFRSVEYNRSCGSSTVFDSVEIRELSGAAKIEAEIEGLNFPPGFYTLQVYISNASHIYDYAMYTTAPFEVPPRSGIDEVFGAYLIPARWRVKHE